MGDGGVSIKVAIRCRPFTIKNRLGCLLNQSADEQGEVTLINCDYTTTRFPFTYAWWSAYGYQRHVADDDKAHCESMKLIDQQMAYDGCGRRIKKDLLDGNAVVLFAYGLSGSGKTFTVFGPDAMDAPEHVDMPCFNPLVICSFTAADLPYNLFDCFAG